MNERVAKIMAAATQRSHDIDTLADYEGPTWLVPLIHLDTHEETTARVHAFTDAGAYATAMVGRDRRWIATHPPRLEES